MFGLVNTQNGYEIGEAVDPLPQYLGTVSFNFVTADPPHNGHVKMAKNVLSEYADTVMFPLHNYYPPRQGAEYKAKNPELYEHRLEMVQLALRHIIGEVTAGKLYALMPSEHNQTPEELFDRLFELAQYGYSNRMVFVIGTSSLVTTRFQQLTRKTGSWDGLKLLVNERIGYDTPDTRELVDIGFYPELCVLEDLGISSSRIREMIKKGESIENLVPQTIAQYIKDNRLYLDR